MRPHDSEAPRDGSAETVGVSATTLPAAIVDFVRKPLVVAELEIRKLRDDITELLTQARCKPHFGCAIRHT